MGPSIHARIGVFIAVLGCGLLCLLIAFGNITDYGTNFEFVKHVLSMDSIFPNSGVKYRAIPQTSMHHFAYILIIALESAMAFYLLKGAFNLYRGIHQPAAAFSSAKKNAFIGICLGICLWFIGFIVIGGEWFSMWQSTTWNGLGSADRIITFTMLTFIALIVVE